MLEKTWGSATRQRSEATLEEALNGDKRSFNTPSRYTVLRPPLGGCVRSICSCSNNGLEKWWRIFPGDHRTCGTGGRCYLTGWKKATPGKSHIRSLFYEQLDDLGGRTLRWNSNEFKLSWLWLWISNRATSFNHTPFTYKTSDGRNGGWESKIVETMAESLNFR